MAAKWAQLFGHPMESMQTRVDGDSKESWRRQPLHPTDLATDVTCEQQEEEGGSQEDEEEWERERLDWIGLDGLLYMSNIAPYNEKEKKKKKEKRKPIMNRNEPLTKCKPKREKKKMKKINTCRGFRDSFNVRGFLLFFCISDSSTQRSYRPSYHSLNGSHDN